MNPNTLTWLETVRNAHAAGTARIGKREGVKGPTWVMWLYVDGKRMQQRIPGCTSLTEAKAAAKKALATAQKQGLKTLMAALSDAGVRQRSEFSSIADVLDAYWTGPMRPMESTARDVMGSLRIVLCKATGGQLLPADASFTDRERWRQQIGQLSAGLLTRDLVLDYYRAEYAERGLGALDMRTVRREHSSINSTLRQARSVFSKKSRTLSLHHLRLPDLSGFMDVPLLPEPKKVAEELDPLAVVRMVDAVAHLRHTDAEAWLFLSLMGLMGLRNSEALAAHADWLERGADGVWRLNVRDREATATCPAFEIKGATARQIAVPECILDFITGRKGRLVAPEDADYKLDTLQRRASAFVRQFFSGTEKTCYNLRKIGGTVIKERDGERVSSDFLGHVPDYGSARVTRRHYDVGADVHEVRGLVSWEEMRGWAGAGEGRSQKSEVRSEEVGV